MNGYNFSDASDIRLGSSTITALYYGSTLIWPLGTHDYSKEYLTIEATSDSTVIFFKNNDNISRSIQYSKDKNTWNTISFVHPSGDITEASPVSLLAGEKLYLKGSNSSYCTGGGANYCAINIHEGSGNIYGNIMSLIYDDNFYGQTSLNTDYTFRHLFFAVFHNNIIDASNLILPATTLSKFCYGDLFFHCDQLTVAPELPATILARSCYDGMFRGCTSLATAPELPATTLAIRCYHGMFSGCTSLATAPELPATTLPEPLSGDTNGGCYGSMFSGCTSLATAPELPATTLAYGCYRYMFDGCTSLATAPELPATTLNANCYDHMFSDCTALTTAPELPATTLSGRCYNDMFSGCTSLTTAPELPATTLAPECYNGMFDSCTSLNYIKCLATDISATDCLSGWVDGVASTGTFVKNPNMSSWPTGDSGIPSGWTVQDAS